MPGLVPGIHVFLSGATKTWMAGTSPAMTVRMDHSLIIRLLEETSWTTP
jgi:hypothetical protein